jgi:hypothetical protein
VDHKYFAFDANDDQLQEVPSSVGTRQNVTRRVLTKFGPGDGVLEGVSDVVVRDLVPTRRTMDVHTG